jgi:hypothetical protein
MYNTEKSGQNIPVVNGIQTHDPCVRSAKDHYHGSRDNYNQLITSQFPLETRLAAKLRDTKELERRRMDR